MAVSYTHLARTPGVNLHGIQVPQYAHLVPDRLVWYAIVVLVNHDVIGTGPVSYTHLDCVQNGRDLKDVEKNYGIRFSKPL